jgi:adenylylsulfate kinase
MGGVMGRTIEKEQEERRPARRLAPAVVWFTGLSGAGKSTIARRVCSELRGAGVPVESLDGDEIRSLFPGTGFTRPEREAHISRVGFLASRLERHGVTVVAALVSPYRESRAFARSLCQRFVEVYVATPLEECERRDPKGLYARARRGEISNFTGVGDPFEAPERPEITIDTREVTVDQAVAMILERLNAAGAAD